MRRRVFSALTTDCAGLQAANAGGVAVSGLEMSQNAVGLQWSREEVDSKLKVRACTLRMASFALSVCHGIVGTCYYTANPLVHHAWPACCGVSALLPVHCLACLCPCCVACSSCAHARTL